MSHIIAYQFENESSEQVNIQETISPTIRLGEDEVILQTLFSMCMMSGGVQDSNSDNKFTIYLQKLLMINPRLINKQDYLGKTLLMHAIINENFSYVTRLMSIGGIDFSLKTFQTKQSALMFATERGFSTIMFKILSDYNVNDCDAEGRTILMYSVDYFSLVLAILKKDSLNINAKDNKGRNVLMYAVERLSKHKNPFDQKSGLRQSINALIDAHSIDLKAKDNRGKTIVDYVKETKDKELIQRITSQVL